MTPYAADLPVRNGDFTLKITDLTTGKWQHAVIVIQYTVNGTAAELVSAVQKVQIQ